MKLFKQITGFLLVLIAIVGCFYIWFNNIDMTEGRMLLTYWKEYLGLTTACILGYLLLGENY